jgi:esterase/lipase superfamily enzyme
VKEITIVAHSMGNWITLEALRGRSMRTNRAASKARTDKVKNVMLVAPDVDVDVFRGQIRRIGAAKPRIALFVSQDDKALKLSQTIWGGVPRLGEVDPRQEPYRSEFERDQIMVFDLTALKRPGDNAHSRAFDDITDVMAMIRHRLADGQAMTDRGSTIADQIAQTTGLNN